MPPGETAGAESDGQDFIRGGLPLSGTIQIGGAKNAALPLMAASLLTDERLVLTNVPDLADIRHHGALLAQHGVDQFRDLPATAAAGRARSSAPHITSTPRPTTWCARCAPRCWCSGRCVARSGRGARVAAGRLRHRHPADRPAPQGPGAARRRDRRSTRATSSARAERAARRRPSCSRRSRSAPPKTC